MGKGQIPEAGAHRAQRHQPQLLAAAGDIVVQAEECRQRPVELLAGVVRAEEPLGHEGEQHQRRQQRGGLAQVTAELPVKTQLMPALQASTTSRKNTSTPVVPPVMPMNIANSAAAGRLDN